MKLIKEIAKKAAAITALSTALSLPVSNSSAGENGYMYKTAGVNACLNGLISGIGSKLHGQGFWNGFRKGSLAGSIMYAGKYASYNGADKPLVPLAGKAIHALGTSMRDNTYFGQPLFSNYTIDLGPVELSFDKNKGLDTRVVSTSLAGIAYSLAKHGRLDSRRTLSSGNLVFLTNGDDYISHFYDGTTIGNTVLLNNYGMDRQTFGHELIHTAQDKELGLLDRIVNEKLSKKKNWFTSISDKLTLPRLAASAIFAPLNDKNYDSSPIEIEAEYGYAKTE